MGERPHKHQELFSLSKTKSLQWGVWKIPAIFRTSQQVEKSKTWETASSVARAKGRDRGNLLLVSKTTTRHWQSFGELQAPTPILLSASWFKSLETLNTYRSCWSTAQCSRIRLIFLMVFQARCGGCGYPFIYLRRAQTRTVRKKREPPPGRRILAQGDTMYSDF